MKEGQRVRLVPTKNCPEEYGIIIAVEKTTILVSLNEQYRDDEYDDGLREAPYEQIEIQR